MGNFNFNGINKKENYFEGWFLKISDTENNSYSFIFGITFNENDPHSFIQIIDQKQDKQYYFRFKVSEFNYKDNLIFIGENILSKNRLKLSTDFFNIDVSIKPITYLKKRLLGSGAMSFMEYFPLPTKHEIVFMNAEIEGIIKTINRDSKIYGTGYMEKNLGTRFPKRWLWIQANEFLHNNIALVIAKADLIGKIPGFFCFLNINGKEYRFATYNGSKITSKRNNDIIEVILKNDKYMLKIKLKWKKGNILVAPIKKAKMQKRIEESLKSTLVLTFYKNKKMVLCDSSFDAGCEYLY